MFGYVPRDDRTALVTVIETMTFRLHDDIDLVAFIAADECVQQDFSYQQPGIERRSLSRADDGTWLVLTHWGSLDAAVAATDAFPTAASHDDFMQWIDAASVEVRRYSPSGAG